MEKAEKKRMNWRLLAKVLMIALCFVVCIGCYLQAAELYKSLAEPEKLEDIRLEYLTDAPDNKLYSLENYDICEVFAVGYENRFDGRRTLYSKPMYRVLVSNAYGEQYQMAVSIEEPENYIMYQGLTTMESFALGIPVSLQGKIEHIEEDDVINGQSLYDAWEESINPVYRHADMVLYDIDTEAAEKQMTSWSLLGVSCFIASFVILLTDTKNWAIEEGEEADV